MPMFKSREERDALRSVRESERREKLIRRLRLNRLLGRDESSDGLTTDEMEAMMSRYIDGRVADLGSVQGMPAMSARQAESVLPPWPGPYSSPAVPRPGGHAEVTMTGTKGHTGGGIPLLTNKNQALVMITWPGGSTSRTIKGNWVIRKAMEWCAAFNAECDRL
jgi:hypothetical protein